MSSHARRKLLAATAAVAIGVGGLIAVTATAAAAATRTESVVTTSSPISSVVETVVSIKAPLPFLDGFRPAGCDWLSYLRYRDAGGPSDYRQADKILLAQPGIFEGAGAFDSVARNTVVAAAAKGKHIEFWALDRRSNCLEDHTGVQGLLASKDQRTAVDYYYNGKTVNGKKFAGFQSSDDVPFLAHVGLEQTVVDQYAVMAQAFPAQADRKRKFLCGGHSLGGIVTGFFATWDFDGNKNTTSDAGYQQCGGYFALDTLISTSAGALTGMPDSAADVDTGGLNAAANWLGYATIDSGLTLGIVPRVLALPTVINPETTTMLSMVAALADLDGDAQSTLAQVMPHNFNIDSTLQILFSKDWGQFAVGGVSARDINITNNALLGGIMDDNSEPLGFLQASVGFLTGGPVDQKNFPFPSDLISNPTFAALASLAGTDAKAYPAQVKGPLYGWLNYDQIAGASIPATPAGAPYTTPGKEATDIKELARSMSEQPLDFTEDYFPTKLTLDLFQAAAPQIADKASHKDGIAANPTLTIRAGDGLIAAASAPADAVTAPGYNHLDVLTASPVQNNGQPEIVSNALANFVAKLG